MHFDGALVPALDVWIRRMRNAHWDVRSLEAFWGLLRFALHHFPCASICQRIIPRGTYAVIVRCLEAGAGKGEGQADHAAHAHAQASAVLTDVLDWVCACPGPSRLRQDIEMMGHGYLGSSESNFLRSVAGCCALEALLAPIPPIPSIPTHPTPHTHQTHHTHHTSLMPLLARHAPWIVPRCRALLQSNAGQQTLSCPQVARAVASLWIALGSGGGGGAPGELAAAARAAVHADQTHGFLLSLELVLYGMAQDDAPLVDQVLMTQGP